jgi:hypothetical protein
VPVDPPLSRLGGIEAQGPLRILDFDLETLAAGFADPEWVPQKITVAAWSWIGEDAVEVSSSGKAGFFDRGLRLAALVPLVDAIRSADVLTGHNILRFDLRVLNADLIRCGGDPLPEVVVQDTMRIPRAKGLKKGQDDLSVMLGSPLKKKTLNWEEWDRAYEDYDWADAIERCRSDVQQHKQLRARLLDRHLLRAPRTYDPPLANPRTGRSAGDAQAPGGGLRPLLRDRGLAHDPPGPARPLRPQQDARPRGDRRHHQGAAPRKADREHPRRPSPRHPRLGRVRAPGARKAHLPRRHLVRLGSRRAAAGRSRVRSPEYERAFFEQVARAAGRWPDANEVCRFFDEVNERLAKGAKDYGDSWAGRPVPDLTAEVREEAADIPGWLALDSQSVNREAAGNLIDSGANAEIQREFAASAALALLIDERLRRAAHIYRVARAMAEWRRKLPDSPPPSHFYED